MSERGERCEWSVLISELTTDHYHLQGLTSTFNKSLSIFVRSD